MLAFAHPGHENNAQALMFYRAVLSTMKDNPGLRLPVYCG